MKIGILGAPGVGKSQFARQLRTQLDEYNFVIADDYVSDLRFTTGLEYGEFGDFVDDLQIAFKRRELELACRVDLIAVGTVLDSVIHNFIRTELPAPSRYEVGLRQERLAAIAATFGLLYTETWDYDYAFFLPSDDRYGKAMRELIIAYHAPVFTFNPEVTDDEKASTAAAAIRALEGDDSSSPEERRVRSGDEDGSEDGDSSDPMSDVPEQGNDPDDA